MSPTNKSLLSIFVSCVIFSLLLVNNNSKQASINKDSGSHQKVAQQISAQLNQNVKELSDGLSKFSNHSFWQSSEPTNWALNLFTQEGIYKAAGLDYLGVYASENKQFYLDNASQSTEELNLKKPINRLYKSQRATQIIQMYQDQPAIILLTPIKSVENKMIGALVGIKLVNSQLLKNYHFIAKRPIALLKNGNQFQLSIESSIALSDYHLFEIEWPMEIKSSVWKMALITKKESLFSNSLLLILASFILTFLTLGFVWLQLKKIKSSIELLNQSLNIDLPIAEQIKLLNQMNHESQDEELLTCANSVKNRFEQLSQQKKALSIELRKLQEEQLRLEKAKNSVEQERDSAVAAPRLKSEFLSRMGDEITTPMKSMVSMLKLLSEYPFEPEPKQLLTIAKRSTRTLVNNLNNILDFSKLDADMLKLRSKEFSIRELVDELSSELSHFANEKDLSLQASSAPEIPALVLADEYRIKQIIRNLLGNAIRFTKSGEVSLYADLVQNNNQTLLRFTIADTGIGITPAAQKELFDSLEQTTKLRNSSFAGRLRLIVSKKLAELMGGEIGVDSEIGKGSRFWFTVTYKD